MEPLISIWIVWFRKMAWKVFLRLISSCILTLALLTFSEPRQTLTRHSHLLGLLDTPALVCHSYHDLIIKISPKSPIFYFHVRDSACVLSRKLEGVSILGTTFIASHHIWGMWDSGAQAKTSKKCDWPAFIELLCSAWTVKVLSSTTVHTHTHTFIQWCQRLLCKVPPAHHGQ